MGGNGPAQAAKAATATIPIVFVSGGDPVSGGLVASLNRPGGNITGVSWIATALVPKQLELLRRLARNPALIGALVNPGPGLLGHSAAFNPSCRVCLLGLISRDRARRENEEALTQSHELPRYSRPVLAASHLPVLAVLLERLGDLESTVSLGYCVSSARPSSGVNIFCRPAMRWLVCIAIMSESRCVTTPWLVGAL